MPISTETLKWTGSLQGRTRKLVDVILDEGIVTNPFSLDDFTVKTIIVVARAISITPKSMREGHLIASESHPKDF
jgi:hypothetical protein